MVGDPDAVPRGVLESIAFLARSHNRVALLATLSTGACTPSELHGSTGVARTTVGRIVNEFEERGWAQRTSDGTYVTTPAGDQVADEFHCLVGVAPPVSFETAMADAVAERGMTVEHVISAEEFAYIREDRDRVRRWRAYVDAGANVYCYDDEVPCNLLVFDETVCIGNTQSEHGEPYTFVESTDDVVRSWAHEVIAAHKDAATPLDADAFAPDHA